MPLTEIVSEIQSSIVKKLIFFTVNCHYSIIEIPKYQCCLSSVISYVSCLALLYGSYITTQCNQSKTNQMLTGLMMSGEAAYVMLPGCN